jgi:hypothetical protein
MSECTIEMQALCVRAAEQEARRQAARQRGDVAVAEAAERKLAALWRRYGELDRERAA